ncbi:tRNA (cytidine(34)-2'-O)-methyltransferase [SAR202 cluster bacterium AD-804-J14_MRT_500m]|nr:tRNA (cytidine(34)-2'-O)-methyltransferase [SAR202 cluster bacterium AD-804-J14_MRT_500m]
MDCQPKLNVVLVTPEIPQNTGNIIRLCANVGAILHLVKPLGFRLDNSNLRRASLDYSDLVDIRLHDSIDSFWDGLSIETIYGAAISGSVLYTTPKYNPGDSIILGPESVGLPENILGRISPQNRVHIPMAPANRSLNISNATAIIVYEMWRQINFLGASISQYKDRSYFS